MHLISTLIYWPGTLPVCSSCGKAEQTGTAK